MKFSGVITALVTPFHDGKLDLKSWERLLHFQLDHKIEGVVIAGTTGESPCLTDDERHVLFTRARAVLKSQVPILCGTGANSTAQSVLLTRQAEQWGADGALVVCPYYNKPPQRGLVAHFKAVAESVSLPVMLYNVPSRTACELKLEAILELSEIKNIVGLKEASGSLSFLETLVTKVPKDFTLTSGDDGTAVDFIKKGGHGVISVISNILPGEMVKLCSRAQDGASYDRWLDLTKLLFSEANPIPVKAALQMMKVIDSDELRLPLMRLESPLRDLLSSELRRQGVLS